MKAKFPLIALTCATVALTTQNSMAQDTASGFNPQNPWTVELETGPAWFKRNNVRIPNDTGTRFDMLRLTGNGPDAFQRLYASYDFNERHALRLNIAPLEVSGNGTLPSPVRFQDTDFAAGIETRGHYKFNNYRLTYRWMFHRSDTWDLGLGAALLVRDAKIALRQGTLQDSDDDLGVVPLLHLYGAYHLTPRTSVVADFEGAAAPQGRAVDFNLKVQHHITPDWHVYAGYRTLEGGADNDSLYTFAWVHYATFGLGFRF
jgi:hypothetical protein